MDRRVFGIETEYGLSFSPAGHGRLTPEEVAKYLFRYVIEFGRSSNIFLTNGSRLYLDVGSHPEYATAECDDVAQLIAHDRAGEVIMQDLAERAELALAADGYEGSVYLFKNNSDSAGNSYGCHENFMIPRRVEFARLAEILIPFLVTRQLFTGAGQVREVDGEARYVFSQRAAHMWEGVSSATTRSRPIINTRDEPHADAQHYRRLHVIVGDSSMSETTQLAKIGSTDLLLRMIEAGMPMRDFSIANPTAAIRDVSHDLTGRAPITLADGRRMTALELQQVFWEKASAFVEREGAHHQHLPRVLDLWKRSLEAIESQDHSGIDTEVDWAIKHRLITGYAERANLTLDHPRIAQLDLTYHDIAPGRGLFDLLKRRGRAATVVDDAEVEKARTIAPQTTRAKLRGDFVRAAREANRDFSVDWVHMKLNDDSGRTVSCKDPFATQDDQVEQMLATIASS
ncbi:Pup--protein ligase [Zhihengliuella halotolerans]|uniref:Pup--protein ligase n=1 Tax=Zhihengliuella halotolerans TaxID=370736 RepID=A0A4V2G9S1_9MICC|nr:Pup--protein ligase [Zhihengliuella halotolerans]RZU61406.1 proteasome accessory factor A [Zhihengliuella halotolerans]